MVIWLQVKTTIEIPDELLIAAKKRAAETRSTVRALVERGLRREIQRPSGTKPPARRPIRWVSAPGGLPSGLDLSSREKMWEGFEGPTSTPYR